MEGEEDIEGRRPAAVGAEGLEMEGLRGDETELGVGTETLEDVEGAAGLAESLQGEVS